MEPPYERFQVVLFAFSDYLHPAVEQVPHPTSQVEGYCPFSGVVPIEYSLDASLDEYMGPGFHGYFFWDCRNCFRHSSEQK